MRGRPYVRVCDSAAILALAAWLCLAAAPMLLAAGKAK